MIRKLLRLVVNTYTADEKYCLLKSDNLTHPIHSQLYHKKNPFPEFFCIFEMHIKFWTFFKKRWPSYVMFIRNYGLRETWLDNCLKNPVSEDTSRSNMVNGPKHSQIWTGAPLTNLLITVKGMESEKVSHSDMKNLKNHC